MVLQIRAGCTPDQQLATLQSWQNHLILRLKICDTHWRESGAEDKRGLLRQLRTLADQISVLDRQILECQAG